MANAVRNFVTRNNESADRCTIEFVSTQIVFLIPDDILSEPEDEAIFATVKY